MTPLYNIILNSHILGKKKEKAVKKRPSQVRGGYNEMKIIYHLS